MARLWKRKDKQQAKKRERVDVVELKGLPQLTEDEAADVPTMTADEIISRAQEESSRRAAQVQAERDQERGEAWAAYRQIISADKMSPDVAVELADLLECGILGLTAQDVATHRRVIQTARRHEAEIARGPKANDELTAQRDQTKAMIERHKQEAVAARIKEGQLYEEVKRGNNAPYELKKLAKQFPDLFDTTTDPPRLAME